MLPRDAEKEIRNGAIAPIYLVYGEEAYWHDKLIGALSTAFGDGTEHMSGDEVTWPYLRELLVQPSFFGPRAWIVRGVKPLFAQKPESWVHVIAQGNCLFLSSVTKDNPAPKAFTKSMEELGGEIIKSAQPSFRDASFWARTRLKDDGYTITGDALENLIFIVGRSIERLDMEIDKLELYTRNTKKIDSSAVLDCVSPDPEMNTFALVDAVANRNVDRTFEELGNLRARGTSPVFLIAVLGSHFGLMWRAKEAVQKGIARDALGRALGVHPYAARKALEQGRIWQYHQLERAIRVLCSADESLKSGLIGADSAMDFVLVSLFAN